MKKMSMVDVHFNGRKIHEREFHWEAYVSLRPSPGIQTTDFHRIIKSCTFDLHPDYKERRVIQIDSDCQTRSCSFKYKGSGYFDITVTVEFYKEVNLKPLKSRLKLGLSGRGARMNHKLRVSRRQLNEAIERRKDDVWSWLAK